MARVVISRCLGLDACRYNGEMIDASWIVELVQKAEVISICPEMDIGLGVPRLPINLIECNKGLKVVQKETGTDLTEELVSFSQGYLRFLKRPDAFVLKSRSPSCGLGTTKIYTNDSYNLGSGIFASLAREFFPEAVFVDEFFMEENGVEYLLRLIKQS